MIKFEYVSANNNSLNLLSGDGYKLINFDGQTVANSSLSNAVTGFTDGDTVNNIRVEPRTITIYLRILSSVELTKRKILEVIKIKQQGTIRWTQENKTVEIKCKVESVEMPRWTNATVMQITMHCEQPFWEDINYTTSNITQSTSFHYFTTDSNDMLYFLEEGIPFGSLESSRTITNEGDVAVGLEIEIYANSTVTNPILYNQDNKFFGCGYGTGSKKVVLSSGDTIKIITRKNEKIVTKNGESILDKIKPNSTWLQLESGDNSFAMYSDETGVLDNMSFSIKYKQKYI